MAFKDLGRQTLGAALAAGLAVAGGGALAQSAGAKAANMRHEKFETMGRTFKALNDELKKDAPGKAVVVRHAATINALAGQLPTWFPKGSGKEARPKSEALPAIWSDAAGFSAAAATLRTEAGKLNQVAPAGDMAAIRIQAKATGQACGGCHRQFREKK